MRLPTLLLAVFLALWFALAISPVSREDWLLENVLTVAFVGWLVWEFRKQPLTNLSYACIFAFLALHTIGSHYTYSLVPYNDWAGAVTGHVINEGRNHYDRFAHLAYGLLIVVPSIEWLDRIAPPRGAWRVWMPVLFIMAHSTIYELIEWGAAMVVAPELGDAYLGTQGDVWDAQKDMALATLGATITVAVLALTRTAGFAKRT